jgi:solute carrier family 9B (sodium/hydrogen exchanger), member 1/2
MLDVALIILFALIGNYLFNRAGLPGLLGMMVTGMMLGPSGFNIITEEVQTLLMEFKTVALIVILIRAGLGVSKETLNRIGGPALRMSFIPGAIEGVSIMAAAYLLLDLDVFEAGMLGFIIAAVSPAVVVPSMLHLKELGFGKKKEVPTLILAGASLDDVFAITIFGVFAGLAAGDATNWTYVFLGVPAGIVLGALIGAAIGFAFTWFFKKYHLRDTMKVIIFLIVSVIFYELVEVPAIKNIVPIAALLGIMAIGFVLLEKYNILAIRLANKFNKVWVFAEILLFVYIGSEVRLVDVNTSLIGVGILILIIGLFARSVGVYLSLIKSHLNFREKLFCVIAYWPKATVQAAMGAVPLTMVLNGQMSDMTIETGQLILTMAVLSIVVTAPLGAIGIKLTGPKLLGE